MQKELEWLRSLWFNDQIHFKNQDAALLIATLWPWNGSHGSVSVTNTWELRWHLRRTVATFAQFRGIAVRTLVLAKHVALKYRIEQFQTVCGLLCSIFSTGKDSFIHYNFISFHHFLIFSSFKTRRTSFRTWLARGGDVLTRRTFCIDALRRGAAAYRQTSCWVIRWNARYVQHGKQCRKNWSGSGVFDSTIKNISKIKMRHC